MNTAEMRVLIDAEIEQTSGAAPNLGGYIYCNEPGTHEGLYVGQCPVNPWVQWIRTYFGPFV